MKALLALLALALVAWAVLRREPHAEADLWRDEPGGGW
ncbi:hypothetical protein UFOVP1028_17 [uncultured Caudovirales phage]|uniref:Uncharacterized protein n=1 Tax=uncultured Caudovirales phage TaxID=2100421 RepID=A0A6J5R799_9CAUD|nr:hypothetical protein UFOVP960_28 [uncultured Caudovirales phage]CAB4178912.1 hypothetical protein UFOVP1028_17 [uncultured Caudovirales phage]CAB4189391.1 hypothetical protein UFOVP1187_2 [uncultured Caudovirales phage]CAB4192236.1 hypothetical protein UFOVP1235_19 [uncultured Caudovirales phage]CAB4215766.1 hypothetical protein UFOVP1488_2 [uncultured Caudovirales phage]